MSRVSAFAFTAVILSVFPYGHGAMGPMKGSQPKLSAKAPPPPRISSAASAAGTDFTSVSRPAARRQASAPPKAGTRGTRGQRGQPSDQTQAANKRRRVAGICDSCHVKQVDRAGALNSKCLALQVSPTAFPEMAPRGT
eukprot:1844423-Pyramimonas_sp.AAC.1